MIGRDIRKANQVTGDILMNRDLIAINQRMWNGVELIVSNRICDGFMLMMYLALVQ
ncbi:hypothetical protein D3C76_1544750 [compost metagenome]|jgi:hypothetical protein